MSDFKVAEWASSNGLTAKTCSILEKEELVTEDALETMTPDQIDSLSLTMGQTNLLKKAIRGLHHALPAQKDDKPPVTTKSLAQDEEVTKLLATLKDSHLKDLLELTQDHTEPSVTGELFHGATAKPKYLLIPDHVSFPKSTDTEEETELFSSGSKRVLLKSAKTKPKVENVTLPQWISANGRILLKLIAKGCDMQTVKDYLQYNIELGDYLQTCTQSSVLILDDAHRRAVSDQSKRYSEVDAHHRYFYLERKPAAVNTSKATYRSQKKPSQAMYDADGQELCRLFAKYGSCKYGDSCKFIHQRSPVSDDLPPRFRQQTGT